jgi:hydrogenase maturation protease HycI
MEMKPMSRRSWKTQLRQLIQTNNRIAIVGVGHELRGDDAVGVQIVRTLQRTMPEHDNVLLCDACSAPENITGTLRRFQPDAILLIDAVQMYAPPGAVRLLEVDDTTGYPSSTHTLPLTVFAHYLHIELNCATALLGIQPVDLSFGASLTPPVRASKNRVAHALLSLLTQNFPSKAGKL